jgi:pilus assembly protein CpaB
MSRARLFIFVVVTLAIFGAIGYSTGLLGSGKKKQATKEPPNMVLVATRDLALGDPLSDESVKWVAWPKDNVAPGMIVRKDDPEQLKTIKASRARQPIYLGEPISSRKLVDGTDPNFLSAMINKGRRAVTVSISAETGVGGFILPNDRVDVLVIRKDSSKPMAKTIITDVRVLALDQNVGTREDGDKPKPSKSGIAKTATLELSPGQALALAEASSGAKITLALRALAEVSGGNTPSIEEPAPVERSIGLLRYGVKTVIQVNP